jgi:hypothetical protein
MWVLCIAGTIIAAYVLRCRPELYVIVCVCGSVYAGICSADCYAQPVITRPGVLIRADVGAMRFGMLGPLQVTGGDSD